MFAWIPKWNGEDETANAMADSSAAMKIMMLLIDMIFMVLADVTGIGRQFVLEADRFEILWNCDLNGTVNPTGDMWCSSVFRYNSTTTSTTGYAKAFPTCEIAPWGGNPTWLFRLVYFVRFRRPANSQSWGTKWSCSGKRQNCTGTDSAPQPQQPGKKPLNSSTSSTKLYAWFLNGVERNWW